MSWNVCYTVSFTPVTVFAFSPVQVSTVVHTDILRIDPCNSGDSSAARTGRGAMHGFLFLPPDASHTRPSTSRDNLHHPSPLDRLRLRDKSCVGACRCAAQVSGNCTREQSHQTCPRSRIPRAGTIRFWIDHIGREHSAQKVRRARGILELEGWRSHRWSRLLA